MGWRHFIDWDVQDTNILRRWMLWVIVGLCGSGGSCSGSKNFFLKITVVAGLCGWTVWLDCVVGLCGSGVVASGSKEND